MKKTMCRTIDLTEYIPLFLRNVREFQELVNGENPEFDLLQDISIDMMCNQFIKDSTEYGVERWEDILDIIPSTKDTLESRQTNILLKLNSRIPYSYKWLVNLLESCLGADNYILDIDYENYVINIKSPLTYSEIVEVLKKDLSILKPANMILDYKLFTNISQYTAIAVVQEKDNTYIPAGTSSIEEHFEINTSVYNAVMLNISDHIKI